jgi:threonine/homoserine/homoserine lactone efflux protein
MDPLALGVFLVSATALLGSPGPGIAALVTIGRAEGFSRGLRYYAGLQVGLAAAAAISAAGLISVLLAFPAMMAALTLVATVYLVYLAYSIATVPVGSSLTGARTSSSPVAGLLLGLTNPKAFAAFATLFASHRLLPADPQADLFFKWLLCVLVILVVDLAWLLVGVGLNKASLPPAGERVLNLTLGALIVCAAILIYL